jgi:hypothetical protein
MCHVPLPCSDFALISSSYEALVNLVNAYMAHGIERYTTDMNKRPPPSAWTHPPLTHIHTHIHTHKYILPDRIIPPQLAPFLPMLRKNKKIAISDSNGQKSQLFFFLPLQSSFSPSFISSIDSLRVDHGIIIITVRLIKKNVVQGEQSAKQRGRKEVGA